MNHPQPKQARRRHRNVQNGRFDSDLRLTAVNDQRYFPAEGFEHMLGIGGGNLIGGIGAGGGEREPATLYDRLHKWMSGPTNANRLTPGSHHIRYLARARKYEGKRPRPKSGRELVRNLRPLAGASPGHLDARDVNDNRVVRRTAFDLEDLLDGPWV